MDLAEYRRLFPNERVFGRTLVKADGTSAVVREGMLLFDDSACDWAGPFEGGYAYFALLDNRNLPGTGKLTTEAEMRQAYRFAWYTLPGNRWKDNAKSEDHLQKRLATLSNKERKAWEDRQASWRPDWATLDNPFSLYLAGNDDTSYTKFFPTLEAAQEELDLFVADQPLNTETHIRANGFVFTN